MGLIINSEHQLHHLSAKRMRIRCLDGGARGPRCLVPAPFSLPLESYGHIYLESGARRPSRWAVVWPAGGTHARGRAGRTSPPAHATVEGVLCGLLHLPVYQKASEVEICV